MRSVNKVGRGDFSEVALSDNDPPQRFALGARLYRLPNCKSVYNHGSWYGVVQASIMMGAR